MVLLSVNLVESCIRTEDFRNDDSVLGLIVFKECGYDARKSEGTAVESMAELWLAVLVTIAEMETVSLIGLEIGD